MADKPKTKGRPKAPQQPTAGSIPFYITVTPVNEKYTDPLGAEASYDLPLVTLPAGTVLFRGVKLPNGSRGDDIRYMYRDFLGNPEADGVVCMSPVHNVFFYPFPHIFFGTHTIGASFNMLEIVVLVHPVNVVCATSPSSWVRGQGQRYGGTAPWQRCGSFIGPEYDCHPITYKETEAKQYDNCLLPEYQVRSGTRGWMAIADLDSINPKKKSWGSDKPMPMKDSTMGKYIRELHSRLPEEAVSLLLKTYKDDHQHAGYPEIALYPYKRHQGRKLITRRCATDNDAIKLIEEEAKSDNLNYLPLALITANGVIDMVNGHFSYGRTGVTGDYIKNSSLFDTYNGRHYIERHTAEFMKGLQEKGITLPFYGNTKLSFDTRTGFYVFPEVIPTNLRIKIPEPILYKNLNITTPSNADKKVYENELYRNFCMPLVSEEDKRRVHIYEIMFRSFLPEHFLEKYGLEAKYGRRRAFIFERYPYLDPLFKELEIPFPKQFIQTLGRAGALYRKETGKKRKEKPQPVPASNAAGAAAAAAVAMNLTPESVKYPYAPASPVYYPSSPAYGEEGEEGGHTPAYGPATPPYNATGEGGHTPPGAPPVYGEGAPGNEGGHTPAYGATTPPYNAAGANREEGSRTPVYGSAFLPPRGGYRRKTRSKGKHSRRTTRRANNTNKINSNAMMFNRVWATHGAVKQRFNS